MLEETIPAFLEIKLQQNYLLLMLMKFSHSRIFS